MQGLARVKNAAVKALHLQPFTLRGLLVLIFSVLIITQYAVPESDLIASVLGGGFLLLLISALAGSLFGAFASRRTIELTHNFENENLVSHRDLQTLIRLKRVQLPPFFQIRLRREFRTPIEIGKILSENLQRSSSSQVLAPEHVVARFDASEEIVLSDSVRFPHRGRWELAGIRCTISDRFGLSSTSWLYSLDQIADVSAPLIPIRMLPIVASSSRSGDQVSATRERMGDPFDLKAYDPSDGISRILWKTYAKSGELVVRRPEPAVVPEGEIPIFVIARRIEDEVVGAATSFIQMLDAQNVTPLVSVDGTSDLIPSSDLNIIRERFTEDIWGKDLGKGESYSQFLRALDQLNPFLTHIVIFVSERNKDRALSIPAQSIHQVSVVVVPSAFRSEFGEKVSHANILPLASVANNVTVLTCERNEFDQFSQARTEYGEENSKRKRLANIAL